MLSFPRTTTRPRAAVARRRRDRAPVAAANNPDDPAAELRLLLVHGILHLLGHDHDDEADRAAMWAGRIGTRRPRP